MEASVRDKIILLASDNLLTAYKIGKGSGISVTTISQILDKNNKKNFKESTLLKVLKYLEEKNNQSLKTTEAKTLESKKILNSICFFIGRNKTNKQKVTKN